MDCLPPASMTQDQQQAGSIHAGQYQQGTPATVTQGMGPDTTLSTPTSCGTCPQVWLCTSAICQTPEPAHVKSVQPSGPALREAVLQSGRWAAAIRHRPGCTTVFQGTQADNRHAKIIRLCTWGSCAKVWKEGSSSPAAEQSEDVDAGRPHPGLQVVHGQGDVLRVALVEHPHLPVGGGPRHAVPVVVEQHPLVLQGPVKVGLCVHGLQIFLEVRVKNLIAGPITAPSAAPKCRLST